MVISYNCHIVIYKVLCINLTVTFTIDKVKLSRGHTRLGWHLGWHFGLLSSSVIVAVAVSAAPITTILPGMAVNMAVNVSVVSSVSSFTTVTLTICTVSLGAKVSTIFVCPVKSTGSEEC